MVLPQAKLFWLERLPGWACGSCVREFWKDHAA